MNSSEMMMDAESFDYTDRVFIMLCTRFVFIHTTMVYMADAVASRLCLSKKAYKAIFCFLSFFHHHPRKNGTPQLLEQRRTD
jgi:hypothetical protein